MKEDIILYVFYKKDTNNIYAITRFKESAQKFKETRNMKKLRMEKVHIDYETLKNQYDTLINHEIIKMNINYDKKKKYSKEIIDELFMPLNDKVELTSKCNKIINDIIWEHQVSLDTNFLKDKYKKTLYTLLYFNLATNKNADVLNDKIILDYLSIFVNLFKDTL